MEEEDVARARDTSGWECTRLPFAWPESLRMMTRRKLFGWKALCTCVYAISQNILDARVCMLLLDPVMFALHQNFQKQSAWEPSGSRDTSSQKKCGKAQQRWRSKIGKPKKIYVPLRKIESTSTYCCLHELLVHCSILVVSVCTSAVVIFLCCREYIN